MKTPRITHAVGHIDDDLINGAANSSKVVKKKTWIQWGSIAASFALIICMFPLVNYLIDINNRGGGPANANPVEVGAWYVNNKEDSPYFCTNIYYKSCEDNKITILLEKADNETIYWYLKGMNIKDSWLDENGKPDYDATTYYASTDSKYEVNGTRVEDVFVFIVNGEQVDTFPTQAGIYEITIDFSKLADMCTDLDPYFVSTYNAFYIDEEKAADYPDDWNK